MGRCGRLEDASFLLVGFELAHEPEQAGAVLDLRGIDRLETLQAERLDVEARVGTPLRRNLLLMLGT